MALLLLAVAVISLSCLSAHTAAFMVPNGPPARAIGTRQDSVVNRQRSYSICRDAQQRSQWSLAAAAGDASQVDVSINLANPSARPEAASGPQTVVGKNGKKVKVVMKFGGSSLANAERVDYVAKLVKGQIARGYQPIMVCSAMGKTTNNLLAMGNFALQGAVDVDSLRTLHLATATEFNFGVDTVEAINKLIDELKNLLNGISFVKELTPRTLDYLVSFGERLSVRIVAARLNQLGVPAQYFDAWTLGMRTTGDFGSAEVLPESYDAIKNNVKKFDDSVVPVVTGFIGQDKDGHITTLGRGGSDLTATTIGAACRLDEVQVWKDVNGIMTANPKVVPTAVPVPFVSFEEASELAYFGAEILHPISMIPAMRSNIPVRVKNSYNPDHPGTLITKDRDYGESMVTAITAKRNVVLVDICSTRMLGQHGFLSRVFSVFEENKISVDCLATSEVSISLTLDKRHGDMERMQGLLDKLREFATAEVHQSMCIISLIANVGRSSEVLATVFEVLKEESVKVEMLSQGASKVNINIVVADSDADKAIRALHDRVFVPEAA